MDVFYTGCVNCNGTLCNRCIEKANNGNYGMDCKSCTITDFVNSKGYCSTCRICGPMYISLTCTDRNYPLSINEHSCTECSTVASVVTCGLCTGNLANGDKGYNCKSCTITSGSTGYCYTCEFCLQAKTYTACRNIPTNTNTYEFNLAAN